MDGAIHMLGALRKLPDGQLQHCLLRHCLDACKVQHLIRSTAFELAQFAASTLSSALRTAITDMVGRSLSPIAWERAT